MASRRDWSRSAALRMISSDLLAFDRRGSHARAWTSYNALPWMGSPTVRGDAGISTVSTAHTASLDAIVEQIVTEPCAHEHHRL